MNFTSESPFLLRFPRNSGIHTAIGSISSLQSIQTEVKQTRNNPNRSEFIYISRSILDLRRIPVGK